MEWRDAEKIGRWTTPLLHRAVRKLRHIECELIREAWADAWFLHTSGFHENQLGAEEVLDYISNIKNLVAWFNRRKTQHSSVMHRN